MKIMPEESIKKKKKKERRKEMRKGFIFFSFSLHSELGTEGTGRTKKRHVGDTPHCWREKATMERVGVLRKDDISNHLGNTGTVSVNDSLYRN